MANEWRLAANRPDDNTDACGGAMDATMRWPSYTETDGLGGGSGDYIDFVSTSAADTQNVTVIGKDADGLWQSETVALTGTSHVQTTNEYLHIRRIELASAANGTVTVSEYDSGSYSELFEIPATEKGVSHLFLYLDAEEAGGSPVVAYEKLFLVPDGSAYSGVKIYMPTDEDSELAMDLEMSGGSTATEGTEQVTNRLTEPTGGGSYSWADHATLGAAHDAGDAEDGNLTDGEEQGIWVRATFAAGATPEVQVLFELAWSATGVS